MWIFMSDGCISVVQFENNRHFLLIRARKRSHLERFTRRAEVHHTPDHDYPYRIVLTRQQFKEAILKHIDRITYTNFKNTIHEKPYGEWAMATWLSGVHAMERYRDNK